MKQFSLTEYFKNSNRKVITREGNDVKIIWTNLKSDFPVIAIAKYSDGTEHVITVKENGKYSMESDVNHCYDLFFAPEKYSRWIFLFYSPNRGMVLTSEAYKFKKNAEKEMERLNGFGLTEITWEE